MSLPPSCSVREAPAVLVIVPTVDVIDGIGHSRRSLCLFFCLSSRRNLLLSLLLFLPLPVLSAPTPNKRHLDRSAGQSHRPARSGEIPVFSLCSCLCSCPCRCLSLCLSSRRDLLLSLFYAVILTLSVVTTKLLAKNYLDERCGEPPVHSSARASIRLRSRALRVSAAARSNSTRASSERPSLARRSPRTHGNRW